MIALADSEQQPPPQPTQPHKHRADVLAVYCKKLSFDIYNAINEIASIVENSNHTTQVPTARLNEWTSHLKELNCRISECACANTTRVDRLQIEMELMQNSMASDLLDRESVHTNTLETINQICAADETSSSTTRVSRAVKIVSAWNASTKPFTCTEPMGYFGAADCHDTHPDNM